MNGKREYDLRDQERREQAANVRVGALCRVEKFDPAAMRLMCSRFPKHWMPACIVPSRRFCLSRSRWFGAAALSCAPATKRGMLGCCSISTTILTALRHLERRSEPNTERNHSDEDAVFIGAFVPASNPLSGLPDNCLVMATEGGGIYVAVKQDKVEIKGDVEVQGKVKVRDDVIAKTISLVNTNTRTAGTATRRPRCLRRGRMANITVLALDPQTGDLCFDANGMLMLREDAEAIAQNVRNNLLTWKGEFPLNTDHGTDWERVVQQPRSEAVDEADSVVRSSIFQEPYVQEISSLSMTPMAGRSVWNFRVSCTTTRQSEWR